MRLNRHGLNSRLHFTLSALLPRLLERIILRNRLFSSFREKKEKCRYRECLTGAHCEREEGVAHHMASELAGLHYCTQINYYMYYFICK